jgi:hypothetical protein
MPACLLCEASHTRKESSHESGKRASRDKFQRVVEMTLRTLPLRDSPCSFLFKVAPASTLLAESTFEVQPFNSQNSGNSQNSVTPSFSLRFVFSEIQLGTPLHLA